MRISRFIWLILSLLRTSIFVNGIDDSAYDEFVEQVVSEDQEHYRDSYSSSSYDADDVDQQEVLRQQKAEERLNEEKRKAEKQKQLELEKIALDREATYAADLARAANDAQQRRALMRQKKRDATVARRILQASHAENHYAVLGLRNNRSIRIIPGRSVTIVPGRVRIDIPEVDFFRVTNQHIKRAFRETAKLVHPDKSKDSRAVEAFHAVEYAASVLLDEKARAEYDELILLRRQARRKQWKEAIETFLERGIRVFQTTRRLLGPLALPAVILAALIF